MPVDYSADGFRKRLLEETAKKLDRDENEKAFREKFAAACNPVPARPDVVGKPYGDSANDKHAKELGERLETLASELGGDAQLKPEDRITLSRHRERMPEPVVKLTAAQENIAEAGRVEDEMNRIMRELPSATGLEKELLLAELGLAKLKAHRLAGYP